MEWIERTDSTVDEAKDFLLDQLGVDEDEAEFEILEEPKPGLFGRVRGQARVRARVAPRTPRVKDDRRRRRPKTETRTETRQNDASTTAAPAEQPRAAAQERPKPAPREEAPARPARDPQEFVAPLQAFLTELVAAFGLVATVEISVSDEGELSAQISGERLGALIGPHGGVINAIQELSRTFLQKEAQGGSSPRLKVDVAHYRASRSEALAEFARRVAADVIATGAPHAFEPMGSVDRKVVHDAVSGLEGIQTRSDGEDPRRRVVVAPL